MLKDFGAFEKRHPVIYIRPLRNSALQTLQQTIVNNFLETFPRPGLMANEKSFNPHITIGYRDLSQASFRVAWQVYSKKNYEAVFDTDRFHLLQHHDHKWKPIAEFKLAVNQ